MEMQGRAILDRGPGRCRAEVHGDSCHTSTSMVELEWVELECTTPARAGLGEVPYLVQATVNVPPDDLNCGFGQRWARHGLIEAGLGGARGGRSFDAPLNGSAGVPSGTGACGRST